MKKIAVIILAAGKSSRFGTNKMFQNLPNGKTIIRHVIDIVKETRLDPVFVVIQDDDTGIQKSVSDLKVKTILNPDYQLGISTSLQKGIRNIPIDCDAAMIVLGDQPFITKPLLDLLAQEYCRSQIEIVFPNVEGIRSNPVILDRAVFPALMELQGDVGARAVFHRYNNMAINWSDNRLLLDLDSPEDMIKITNSWNNSMS